MEKKLSVYIDINATPLLTGYLWLNMRKGKETAAFEYTHEWLASSQSFALQPVLPLVQGQYYSQEILFGCLSDSSPDRWGRMLMQRMEVKDAKKENRQPRTLHPSDYLLRVNDLARQGALRFSKDNGQTFLASSPSICIPPLVSLGKLLSLSNRVLNMEDIGSEISDLVNTGSSIGGARPKATVCDGHNNLFIAKFPSPHDNWDVPAWEKLSLQMAKSAGIPVPDSVLIKIADQNVLLVKRFDRNQNIRIPFLSAMSMLSAVDGEKKSYLDIAEVVMEYGMNSDKDLRELWKRMVFNIMASNLDDHLRNHAFLYKNQSGWCLSPLYDLEPTPLHIKARFLSTSISENDFTASLPLAFEVAKYFGVNAQQARQIAGNIADNVKGWNQYAKQIGISSQEREIMRSAFEHSDLDLALKHRMISNPTAANDKSCGLGM